MRSGPGGARALGVCALLAAAAGPQAGLTQVAGALPEEVVVSASARPIEAYKAGSAITLITGAQLEQRGARYLLDALRHVPGAAVSRSGSFGGLAQLRLRGAEANHVLVLIDGVEVAAASSGELDLSSLLTAGVERVEIIRGPQSGLHGSNAMAGAVNVVTRSGAEGPAVGLDVEAGSFGSAQLSLEAAGGTERRSGALALAYRETDGVNTSPSGPERDGDENLLLTGRGRLDLGDALTLDGAFRYADKASETDGFDFTGGPNQGLSIDTNDYSNTTDAQLTARATWTTRDERWVTQLSGPYFSGDLAGGIVPFGSETTREQLRLQSTLAFGDGGSGRAGHSLTGFVDSKDESFRNTEPTDPSQVPEQSRSLLGIGAEYRVDVGDRFFLSATVRHDDNDGFEDATTRRLTAVYVVPEHRLRVHGSYGTGVTNPTFLEQFGFTPGSFVGNPDVVPEQATGWDLGVEYGFGGAGLVLDFTYFDMDLENEIVSLFPSVINDAGTSRRDGIELTLTGALTERLSLAAAYTYTDAENADGSPEVRRPSRTASVDLTYRLLEDRARLHLGIVHNGEMYDDDFRNFFVNGFVAEKTKLDEYTLVDVAGAYSLSDRLEVHGRIANLLDEAYVSLIGYATPGRASYLGFRYRFAD